jgi:hypothetical protein
MPHRSLLVLFVAAIATFSVLTSASQGQTPPTPLTYEWVVTTTWKDIHDKVLVMAKDTVLPDDKLEWRPHPDARSVLEEFRQVTNGLEWSSAQLRGEKLDDSMVVARRKADAAKPKTRASIVSEMEAAIAISYPLVEKSPSPLLIGWIRDQAEHYGKLGFAWTGGESGGPTVWQLDLAQYVPPKLPMRIEDHFPAPTSTAHALATFD